MFYIYILFSESSRIYYVGYTNDVERRLAEHNDDAYHKFTSKHRPWVLKRFFPVSDIRGEAVKVERYIKKQKSRRFIEQLVVSNDDEIAQLVTLWGNHFYICKQNH